MKYLFSFTVACCLLLSACGDSTSPNDNFSTDIRDYMYAGNPGTEFVYHSVINELDSNGTQRLNVHDTITLTILERNVRHPKGGLSVRLLQDVRSSIKSSSSKDTVYFSFYNNGISRFKSIRDTAVFMIMKDQLTVGSVWVFGEKDAGKGTVTAVGETIYSSFKPMKTVKLEANDTISTANGIHILNGAMYFAPEVLYSRYTSYSQTQYPTGKLRVRADTVTLVKYTKK